MAEHFTWAYAVVTDLAPAVLDGLTGVGGEQVRVVGGAGLSAVAGPVDPAAFGEDALERRLSQPGELELIVRRHHHVIETLAASCPTLPLRLATVYLDEDAVRGLLAERREEFTATLSWLTGHTECGVKVWADAGGLAVTEDSADPPPGGGGDPPGAGAGASYLRRRRADLAAREEGWQRTAALSDDVHAELSALAVAARRHRAQEAGEAGSARPVILNGAYLIEREQMESFAGAAEAAVHAHGAAAGFRDAISLQVTGPWPPYSFADGSRS